ncbi:MAG: glycolate utilization protein [Cereibacter sphaeroides]|uniref:Glycolate utilization protein n=1 Tax=Cereibacter sphaeroides TaxID=1063 RepID=A0A2W5S2Q4_CERSP|nr:MAG: glycolate utilization protein [Cereibacter sphaeroides]
MAIVAETITTDRAARAIAAAQHRAAAIGIAVNVAVIDAGTHLKGFVRMDGAVLGAIDIAIGKARTAVLFAASSEAVWDYCKPDAPAHNLEASNGGLFPFAGGLPILSSDGVLIGAVGVSGGAVPQDLDIAEAAIAALTA